MKHLTMYTCITRIIAIVLKTYFVTCNTNMYTYMYESAIFQQRVDRHYRKNKVYMRFHQCQRYHGLAKLHGIKFLVCWLLVLRKVARRLNCHPSTIARLQRRYQHARTVKDLPKSGRPRVTTRRQDINMRMTRLRDRFTPAAATRHQHEDDTPQRQVHSSCCDKTST